MWSLTADQVRLSELEDQREAVMLLLKTLADVGLEWFRTADFEHGNLIAARAGSQFKPFDPARFRYLGSQPIADFPANQLLVVEPTSGERDSFVGLWVRWDFTIDPIVFRLFVGHWCEIENDKTFVAFRFEAPEDGPTHNFYHCQPCRNIGDRATLQDAARLSEKFPTVPVNAGNVVELTVASIIAVLGLEKARVFVNGLTSDARIGGNRLIKNAKARFWPSEQVG